MSRSTRVPVDRHASRLTIEERDALVVDNLDLVGRIVSEVSARYPRHVDRSELWSAGSLGLVEASRRFDPDTGIPFARYAAIRIRGAIIDSTRTRDWATRSVRRRLREVNEARAHLESRLERSPAPSEVADHLGISLDELRSREAGGSIATLLHLDQPAEGEESGGLGETIAETRSEMSPDDSLEEAEIRGALAEAMRMLPPIQAEVVSRSFLRGEMLNDIALEMGLTEARLSQIRAEGVASLKAFFATQYEGVEEPDPSAPGKRARSDFLRRMADDSTWRSRLDAGQS